MKLDVTTLDNDFSYTNEMIEKACKEYVDFKNKLFTDFIDHKGISIESVEKGDFVIIEIHKTEYWRYKGETFITIYPKKIDYRSLKTKITQNYELNYLKGGK